MTPSTCSALGPHGLHCAAPSHLPSPSPIVHHAQLADGFGVSWFAHGQSCCFGAVADALFALTAALRAIGEAWEAGA